MTPVDLLLLAALASSTQDPAASSPPDNAETTIVKVQSVGTLAACLRFQAAHPAQCLEELARIREADLRRWEPARVFIVAAGDAIPSVQAESAPATNSAPGADRRCAYVLLSIEGPDGFGPIDLSGWHVAAVGKDDTVTPVMAIAHMNSLFPEGRGSKNRIGADDGTSIGQSNEVNGVKIWQAKGKVINVDARYQSTTHRHLLVLRTPEDGQEPFTMRLKGSLGLPTPPTELLLLFDVPAERVASIAVLGRHVPMPLPDQMQSGDRDPFTQEPAQSKPPGLTPVAEPKRTGPTVIGPISVTPNQLLLFGRLARGQAHRRSFTLSDRNGRDLSAGKAQLHSTNLGEGCVEVREVVKGKDLVVEVVLTERCPSGLVRGEIVITGLAELDKTRLQFNGFIR